MQLETLTHSHLSHDNPQNPPPPPQGKGVSLDRGPGAEEW